VRRSSTVLARAAGRGGGLRAALCSSWTLAARRRELGPGTRIELRHLLAVVPTIRHFRDR
jgi:hypothetical protein